MLITVVSLYLCICLELTKQIGAPEAVDQILRVHDLGTAPEHT